MNMLSPVVMSHPEAFQEEYQEQQSILKQMAEESLTIQQAWDELNLEKVQQQPKYARLARKWIMPLRKIFWHGILRDEAQSILEELEMSSTVPLNDLEVAYDKGEDGTYEEVDDPIFELGDLVAVREQQAQWDLDFQEVQAEVKQIEAGHDQGELDGLLFGLCHKVIDRNDPRPGPEVIVQKATPPEGIEAIALENSGPFSRYPEEEDDPWIDDRGFTGLSIAQEQAEELHLDSENSYILLQNWRKFKNACRITKMNAEETLVRLGVKVTNLNVPKEMQVLWPGWMDISWMKLKTQTFQGWISRGDDYLFKIWIGHEASSWPIQDVLIFCIGQGYEGMLDQIKVPGWTNLQEFYETFGDEVLEEALFGPRVNPGLRPDEDERIEKLTLDWENEIIKRQFVDNPNAKNAEERARTRAYARGVFQAVGADVSNLDEAGHEAWRREVSDIGNIAYHKVLKSTGNFRDAWRAFWNVGSIQAVNRDGVKVRALAAHKEQFCPWGLAKWKLARGEIAFGPGDKRRLKDILTQKGWGKALAEVL